MTGVANKNKAERYYEYRGQSFGAASPCRHIDPASVNVTIPDNKPTVQSKWTEIAVDAAFWRAWHMNSQQMRRDGYKVEKAGDEWRAFYLKKPHTA
jgi:hypothetical protein